MTTEGNGMVYHTGEISGQGFIFPGRCQNIRAHENKMSILQEPSGSSAILWSGMILTQSQSSEILFIKNSLKLGRWLRQ